MTPGPPATWYGAPVGSVGAAVVTVASQFHLLEEQERQNALIRSSVESIETAVTKTSNLLNQSFGGLEKRIIALESAGFVKSADLSRVHGDLLKALDSVHEEQVQIKVQLDSLKTSKSSTP